MRAMSDRPVPAYVDTRKIFLQEGGIAGTVALERLPRFRETLASDAGSVSVELEFTTNESGQRVILGRLRAEVDVICQRCLEPLGIVLQDDIKLALVKDEAAIKQLEADFDPWICPDIKLQLAGLVEEQLMLCMPIVSYHSTAECSTKLDYTLAPDSANGTSANGRTNPFSVLKSLKENDGTN